MGITIALEITESGIIFKIMIFSGLSVKKFIMKVKIVKNINSGMSARTMLLNNGVSLFFESSISITPSRTIRIKPILPRIGKIISMFGIFILMKLVSRFSTTPTIKRSSAEGILVFEAVKSNMYDRSKRIHNIMVTVTDMV